MTRLELKWGVSAAAVLVLYASVYGCDETKPGVRPGQSVGAGMNGGNGGDAGSSSNNNGGNGANPSSGPASGGNGGNGNNGGDAGMGGAGGGTSFALWNHTAGAPFEQIGLDIATDSAGASVVVGTLVGTMYLGSANEITSYGSEDPFVAKYDAGGTRLFAYNWGNTYSQFGGHVVVDSNDDIIMAGSFQDTLTIGAFQLIEAGGTDIWIAKLSSNGLTVEWAMAFGDDGSQTVTDMEIDPSTDEIILTGYFTGELNFGGTPIDDGAGLAVQAFLAKLDNDGDHVFSAAYGGVEDQRALAVTVGPSGSIAVVGEFEGSFPIVGPNLSAGPSETDIFVALFNSAGVPQYSKDYGDAGAQAAYDVAIDGNGQVVVVGGFETRTTFLDPTYDFVSQGSGIDAFLLITDSSLVTQYAAPFGDGMDQIARRVTVDAMNNIYVAGSTEGSCSFGGPLVASLGGEDIFLAKFDQTGMPVWSTGFGGPDANIVNGLVLDGSGNIFLTGEYEESTDFLHANGPLTAQPTWDEEAFIVKFSPGPPPQ